jgi:hypothetical protein
VRRIATNFDPSIEKNKQVDYRQGDIKDAYEKTVKERALAEEARVCGSIDEFERVVCSV